MFGAERVGWGDKIERPGRATDNISNRAQTEYGNKAQNL